MMSTDKKSGSSATGDQAAGKPNAKKPPKAKAKATPETKATPKSSAKTKAKATARSIARLRDLVTDTGAVQRPDREQAGKELRVAVPRAAHGDWQPDPTRPDPISLLEEQAKGRVPELVPIRHGRMATSSFGFFRGAAAVMAWDLAHTPTTDISVQACGDAHLMNFGMFATPERRLVFDVNDFDETLPGPWEWDVKRLAASIAVAGRSNGFSRKDIDFAVTVTVGTYRERIFELATMRTLDVWYTQVDVDEMLGLFQALDRKTRAPLTPQAPRIGEMAVKAAAKARTHDTLHAVAKLTEIVDGQRRIVDHPPLIDHVGLAQATDQIRVLYEGYLASLAPELQVLMDRFRLVDVARKVVGVGSVGTRCWIALFEGGADDDPLLLQIKEALPSVLEEHLQVTSTYRSHGERVVHGQRMMQAASDLFLGWSTNPTTGIHYYWRQLHDMKGSANVPIMTPIQLANYGQFCGWTLARAHGRSGDSAMISGYLGTGGEFDRAIAAFAQSYADQNELDHAAMVEAVRSGRIEAVEGV
jgi:uncharacterized protein (DUF2252 family)